MEAKVKFSRTIVLQTISLHKIRQTFKFQRKMQNVRCIAISKTTLLLKNGGGPSGQHALMLWDPFSAHLVQSVRDWLKKNRVDVAVMPASCTWLFQMIDVQGR